MPDGIKIRQLDENTEPVDSDVFVIDSENPNFPEGTSDVSYTRKVSYSTLKTQLESDLDITPGGVTKIVAGNNISINPEVGVGEVTINSEGLSDYIVFYPRVFCPSLNSRYPFRLLQYQIENC